MRLNLTSGSAPPWFYKFVKEEWQDEYRSILLRDKDMESVVEFFNSKGITAWYKNHNIWMDVDFNTPEWTFRMLKYSGEKL